MPALNHKRKGFTLFTALVSTTLILLSVLVIQNMIKTESGINSTISNMQAQTRATTNLDILKSDALQTFNLVLREQVERFYAYRTSLPITSTPSIEDLPGKHIQNFYGVGGAGTGAALAQYIAEIESAFIRKMQERGSTGGLEEFTLSIPSILTASGEVDPNKIYFTQEKLADALQQSFTSVDPVTGQLKFFSATNIIGCDAAAGGDCPVGSYYLLIDFANPHAITDQEFLEMPNIRITSVATERVSEQGMLPRSLFKAYVPLRYFQAVWRTKALYNSIPFGAPYSDQGTAETIVCTIAAGNSTFRNGYESSGQLALQDGTGMLCPGIKSVDTVSCGVGQVCITDVEVIFIEEDPAYIIDGSLESHKFVIGNI